jgi:hypothetical protein
MEFRALCRANAIDRLDDREFLKARYFFVSLRGTYIPP